MTYQTNPMAPWYPLDAPLTPWDPLALSIDPLGSLNRSHWLIELLRSPQLAYKSSEDPLNVPVDPNGHLTLPPLTP